MVPGGWGVEKVCCHGRSHAPKKKGSAGILKRPAVAEAPRTDAREARKFHAAEKAGRLTDAVKEKVEEAKAGDNARLDMAAIINMSYEENAKGE